jgi:hypothetical protein
MKQLKNISLRLDQREASQESADGRREPNRKPEGQLSEDGKYGIIKLSKNLTAKVDLEDFNRVMKFVWSATKSKGIRSYYAARNQRIGVNNRSYIKMHRFILNAPKGIQIDHINGDGLDNRKSNLRPCSIHQNNMGFKFKRFGSSKYRGITFKKKSKGWTAQITYNYKHHYLGFYARKYFKSFASLNFP